MMCLKCERGMKLLRSYSTRKQETWGCPASGCGYQEEYPLCRPGVYSDAAPQYTHWKDTGVLNFWHWDGVSR